MRIFHPRDPLTPESHYQCQLTISDKFYRYSLWWSCCPMDWMISLIFHFHDLATVICTPLWKRCRFLRYRRRLPSQACSRCCWSMHQVLHHCVHGMFLCTIHYRRPKACTYDRCFQLNNSRQWNQISRRKVHLCDLREWICTCLYTRPILSLCCRMKL